MKVLLTVLLIVLLKLTAFSTAQFPDKIVYKGKEYNMHSNPLESYFTRHPEKRPRAGLSSTALWRGYIATFEVREGTLYLKDIEVMVRDTARKDGYGTKFQSVLEQVFPGQTDIKVDWMTGLLVIPYGKLVNYVHMGYGSSYKHYILLEIDKGAVKKDKHLSYRKYEAFKNKQFLAFKKTDEYQQLKASLLQKENMGEENLDDFLKSFIIDYTSRILVD
ncbi:hypothetical protein L3C95_19630 [Chitinophaga filiformis]|uniref:hypothetical protein n=1 Tax=Chitinophaga filiformis TaxID=104663 RepID=UPI001F3719E0|nr:hypothetical protein [Chitinophaga filiformis]MCF6405123.1 hypothetical protein [Chitinophaga filiformis]